MTLSNLSIDRPVLTWMMVLALAVFGLLGYLRLGVDQFPEMEFPRVTVNARLEGATPEGIEEDVTDVLEEHLNTISGVRSLQSTSYQDGAAIAVEFELGVDIDTAIQDVRDRVAEARRRLPPETEPPLVRKSNQSGWPVMYVPFNSHRPKVEFTEYVRRQVKPLLETIPGVAAVPLFGGIERNIRIWVDGEELRARGLAASDVLAALRREHVDRPGGLVEGGRVEWSVKTDAEFRSVSELESLVVAHRDGVPIHLRDVARVEDGTEDVRSISHVMGEPTIAVGIMKQSDGNAVAITNEVYRRLEQLRPRLPEGIDLIEPAGYIDFSHFVRESVAETQFALLFGGLLAVLVVFVFLRRTRPTLIVAAAIPLSLVATFGLIWLAGYTLNTMTLLGMALAIGVVIDDAIIVLENIERHREAGKPARQAAVDGTRQITFAATAATFSVAAVFLPVVFAEGIVGNFLGEFGLTVAGSVMISLFVALTLTPMLAARMPPPSERRHGSIYHRLEVWQHGLERVYRALLEWSLRRRAATFGIALASFAVAIFFASRLPGEFFPRGDSGSLWLRFETPPGSSLEATAEMLARNERHFLAQPELKTMFASVGKSGDPTDVPRASHGQLMAMFGSSDERERSTFELIREAREVLGAIPGQQVYVMDPSASFSSQSEFEVELRGNLALRDLDALADQMVARLRALGGFQDLEKSLEVGVPELRVVPDRERAAALGVDAATLAQVVQVMIGGADVGVFKEGGSRYDIRMRLEAEERDSPEAIGRLSVRGVDGELVELRNLMRIETGAAASEISRTNRQRTVKISGNLDGRALGEAVADAFAVAREILPDGVTLTLAGDAETMQQSFGQLLFMLGLAVLVIYMVLAAQFESFVQPLSVMLALPFSMVGALGGLWVAGMTLNIFSLIGIILLAGLVTKNSILLVDYANQLREEGLDTREAMRRAAPVRMRPVLMTALSMIFGVLPAALGLGPGSETRAPMAVATAAGMLSSMLLTLLIVPVFYVSLDDFGVWLRAQGGRLRARGARAGPSPAGARTRPQGEAGGSGETARGRAPVVP